jgi:hypothetical protein
MDWTDWLIVGVLTAAAAGFVLMLFLGVQECGDKRRCTTNAGRIEEYNCHTVYVTTYCGSGCTMLVPTEVCDWRCVGANPEARP